MTINPEYEKKYESIIKGKILNLCKDKKCRIFLFGSRAQGKITRSSDFDIGITGLSKNDFDAIVLKFDDYIEDSIVPYSIDIINFDTVEDDFKNIALKNIKKWKDE